MDAQSEYTSTTVGYPTWYSTIPAALTVVFFFLFLPARPLGASYAGSIPTTEDIETLAETSEFIAARFLQESFQLRMQYECSSRFLSRTEEESLSKIAKQACENLLAVAEKQQKLKRQIEEYQGDDWEDRFGATGLWRKTFRDVYLTNLRKSEIDFYRALCSQSGQRDHIAQDILNQIDSLSAKGRLSANTGHLPAALQLHKARVLALLSEDNLVYKQLAKKELNELMERSDMSHSTAFRVSIERIKFGLDEPEKLLALTKELSQSDCANDIELVLSLAFLQRKLNQPQGLKTTVALFPNTEDYLGSLLLQELSFYLTVRHPLREDSADSKEQALQNVSVFEAELVAMAAWKDETKSYEQLLGYLSKATEYQTPLIFYVAAIKFAESSPAKAVDFLIRASDLQQNQKSDKPLRGKLEISASEIAKQAAQLAYSLFAQDLLDCQLTLTAFENYYRISADRIDEQLEYVYSIVMGKCGQNQKSKELLEKIVNNPQGNWRNRARLDLIAQTIDQGQYENAQQRSRLLEKLSDLLADSAQKNQQQIRAQALTIYCQLLLEFQDQVSAQMALSTLTADEIEHDPNLNVLKARALRQLNKLEESAACLVKVTDPNYCAQADEVVELLSQIVEQIDGVLEQTLDSAQMIQNCKKLAEYCFGCLQSRQQRQAQIYLAEISIFQAAKDKEKLLAVEKLLNSITEDSGGEDIDLLRCQARLLAEQDKFKRAAGLWAKVCKQRKAQLPPASQRGWKWWRAKFNELACWAKLPQTPKQDVLHTIEVLENSYTGIPPLWAEKLARLKHQCYSSPTAGMK